MTEHDRQRHGDDTLPNTGVGVADAAGVQLDRDLSGARRLLQFELLQHEWPADGVKHSRGGR